MKNIHKKFAVLSMTSFIVTAGAVIAASGSLFKIDTKFARATEENFSIVLNKENAVSYSSKANATYSEHYDNTLTFRTSNSNLLTVKVENSTTSISSSSNLGNLYIYSSLSVVSDHASGTKSFQNISSIKVSSASTAERSSRFFFNESESYSSFSVPARSNATFDTSSLGYAVRSFRYTGTSTSEYSTIAVTEMEISYTCRNDYVEENQLSSITLNTSGVKTDYTVGETFNSSGLVVTAHYTDSTSSVVTPTSISSPDMSSAGNKTVTVSYTEAGITKTATFNITVSEAAAGLDGTWMQTYSSFVFTSSTEGYFQYGGEYCYFTYTVSGSQITFTYKEGVLCLGSYCIFPGGPENPQPNTGTLINSTKFTIQEYNESGGTTFVRTYSKI